MDWGLHGRSGQRRLGGMAWTANGPDTYGPHVFFPYVVRVPYRIHEQKI